MTRDLLLVHRKSGMFFTVRVRCFWAVFWTQEVLDAELNLLHQSVAFERPVECGGRVRGTALVLPLCLALCVVSGTNCRHLFWLHLVCWRFYAQIKAFYILLSFSRLTVAIFLSWLGSLSFPLSAVLLPGFPSIMKSFNRWSFAWLSVGHKCYISVIFHVKCTAYFCAFFTLFF